MSKLARLETHNLMTLDPTWARIRAEAEDVVRREPEIASFVMSTVLNHERLEQAVGHRVGSRLGHIDVPSALIAQAFDEAAAADPTIGQAVRADLMAVVERDPACTRAIEPLLHFKGFHAIQSHRLAHWLWGQGRRDFALYIQSRSSAVFQVDVHPAAPFGRGVFFDHATGVVIGETAVIEDNVSLLHGVTLGGTGKSTEDRHPKIRHGVLIGAGASILGNIEVGHCSRVAANSVVLRDVPPNVTVAGVPARIVGASPCAEPARAMDQIFYDAGL
ncbi:serine O-acetyltransferase [Hansschlegelia plantiphila]|uniref:Serine acetyltransferase n=1 Tax=Hansschlegelia plantiphila TaxID=374655 RepID=A0A9W6J2G9_9HYPH|nr:serine O-acetyltransferase [Hansschlegelia plantiphila]GLK68179.1 serine O-acetyltransferase [Hansschlegelia plantiphila]